MEARVSARIGTAANVVRQQPTHAGFLTFGGSAGLFVVGKHEQYIFIPEPETFRTYLPEWEAALGTRAIFPDMRMQVFTASPREMTDGAVRNSLPLGHVFKNRLVFCVFLARVLCANWGAENGPLTAGERGGINIFYVAGQNESEPVFVVRAYWGMRKKRWNVSALPLGSEKVRFGDKVFAFNA